MRIIIIILDNIINFFSAIQNEYKKIYNHMKIKAFNNKVVYYGIYNIANQKYSIIHNYNNILSILYFYILNYYAKISYAGVSFLDLRVLTQCDNLILITSYIINEKEIHAILNYETYNKDKFSLCYGKKIVYAYTDDGQDLTHEFEKYKNTIFNIKCNSQHIYNILTSKTKNRIEYIKYMMDDDCIEKIIT
jgi:hypothetical protein